MAEDQETRTSEASYHSLLDRYHALKGSIVRLQEGGRIDDYKFIRQNEKLHELHLSLLEAGQSLGKHQTEVLNDVLMLDRNLAEYNLPDLAIKELPGNYGGFSQVLRSGQDVSKAHIFVRVDGMGLRPNRYYKDAFDNGQEIGPDEYPGFLKRWLEKPHMFLVYYGY